ncbi:MAG TPA: sensor histidine kinase, partial [Ruminococcaceae bacterium]|nr:sensor histidine kinase [Oscillospiraceae bacterium]
YHAFGHSSEKGVINIRVLEREGRLIMEIEDNGVGISKERLGEIERGEVGSESGIGIRNVSSRIQIYFGQDYGVSIQSVPDEGTLIRITLPTEITGEDILE